MSVLRSTWSISVQEIPEEQTITKKRDPTGKNDFAFLPLSRPSNGGKFCIGERKRFRICNTEECPPDTPSFRQSQCSEFDYVPYKNAVYEWEPVPIQSALFAKIKKTKKKEKNSLHFVTKQACVQNANSSVWKNQQLFYSTGFSSELLLWIFFETTKIEGRHFLLQKHPANCTASRRTNTSVWCWRTWSRTEHRADQAGGTCASVENAWWVLFISLQFTSLSFCVRQAEPVHITCALPSFIVLTWHFSPISQKVGCDWQINSKAEEDRCGVCHGDGSSCKTVKDTFVKRKGRGRTMFCLSACFS